MNRLWLADQVRAPRRPAAGLLGRSDEPVVASGSSEGSPLASSGVSMRRRDEPAHELTK